MPIIYNVTIKPVVEGNLFRITWYNAEADTIDSFDLEAKITLEEIQLMWLWPRCQLDIGQKLFHFLDGEAHHLLQACNEFSFLNGRISPLSAILADEAFEISLKNLKTRQKRCLDLIRELNEFGVTKAINYGGNNLLPTFFKLYLPWKCRQSKKKLVEFLNQSEYSFTISYIEPIFKNEHFLLQFSKQFERNFKTNCEDIGKEYFDLKTIDLEEPFLETRGCEDIKKIRKKKEA